MPGLQLAVRRPVRRTTLGVSAGPPHVEGNEEILDLVVRNSGPMTALFCEPHPLLNYRTDLFINNNHCFIPPGESRTITIRAAQRARRAKPGSDRLAAEQLERRRRGCGARRRRPPGGRPPGRHVPRVCRVRRSAEAPRRDNRVQRTTARHVVHAPHARRCGGGPFPLHRHCRAGRRRRSASPTRPTSRRRLPRSCQ